MPATVKSPGWLPFLLALSGTATILTWYDVTSGEMLRFGAYTVFAGALPGLLIWRAVRGGPSYLLLDVAFGTIAGFALGPLIFGPVSDHVGRRPVLLGGLAFGRSLLSVVLDSMFSLTEEGWRKLTFRWGVFFFVLAALNEAVWRTQTEDFWVNFKVFGIMPITVLFALAQTPLLTRYERKEPQPGA